jgi:ABC-type uncharacterized transport system substrate-binding protein
MKNTISVFIGADEFECIQYYDTDKNIDGVEVFEAMEHKLIGNIDGLIIPDLDDEDYDSATIKFNSEVEEYLEENYF